MQLTEETLVAGTNEKEVNISGARVASKNRHPQPTNYNLGSPEQVIHAVQLTKPYWKIIT